MGIRKSTIAAKVAKAIAQIEKDKCEAAKVTLVALDQRLSGAGEKKRAPGKYALFVKANYASIQKANPGLAAPAIMKKIAVEWKKQ